MVRVQTPKKLNDKQRELLLRFAQESKEEVDQLNIKKGLFDKIKEAFE